MAQATRPHVSGSDIEVHARAVVFSYNNAPHSSGVSVASSPYVTLETSSTCPHLGRSFLCGRI